MTDRVTSGATFDFVSVKGFGDLVIALTCLQRVSVPNRHRMRLLIGQHLEALMRVLDPPFDRAVFRHPDAGPAPMFQMRSRPPRDVLRSAIGVRRGLLPVADQERVLVFDKIDVRHRFLSFGRVACALPRRDNLYRAWHDFLMERGLSMGAPDTPAEPRGRRLHIFPGARDEERRFPPALLEALVDRARAAGLEPRIFTVAGEMPHLNAIDLPMEELPRDFARTLAAVSQADRIVSADSMTAHLAEYCRVPVYVCAPREKYFWLPLSAAQRNRHALFAEPLDTTTLPAFLES